MQIGNFHIGSAKTAKFPVLSSAEAYMLWDNLTARYDIIMVTQLYLNHVHDIDFRLLLKQGLTEILEKQVNIMEQEMNRYKLSLPERNPKSVNFLERHEVINDEYVFRKLFSGIQSFLESHIRTVRVMIYNDPLREMFINFLRNEIKLYNNLCKYGKLKGWLQVPPVLN